MRGEDKDCGVQQLWPESWFYPSQLGDLGPGPQTVPLENGAHTQGALRMPEA